MRPCLPCPCLELATIIHGTTHNHDPLRLHLSSFPPCPIIPCSPLSAYLGVVSPSSRLWPNSRRDPSSPPSAFPSVARLCLSAASRPGLRWLAIRDMRRRHMFERSEVIRRAYLFVARNETLPDMIRTRAQQAIHRLPKRSTPTQINNTCIETGKGHGKSGRGLYTS